MPTDRLSSTFSALADPTRRAILARLALGETSVTELAEPFRMSMPAVSKHLKVLERAGLITRGREAQWRPCRIEAQALKPVDEWLENYRKLWEERFDRLEVYLRELQANDGDEARRARRPRRRNVPARNSVVAASRSLTLERVFDAPVDLVWRCWTEQEHLAKWSAPRGYTIPRRRGRPPARRQVALPHARSAGRRPLARRRLSRDRAAQAAS